MRRLVLSVAVVAGLPAMAPAAAWAHTTLESTSPERGAELNRAPVEVRLTFNEPVELSFGSLRVFDSSGEEVQSGDPEHLGDRGEEIAVRLPDGLPGGPYTAAYRIVSADSHPVSGGFVFAVGRGSAAPPASVSELIDDPEAGAGTKLGFAAARTGSYAAMAIALGGAVFLFAVWGIALARVARPDPGWTGASDRFGSRSHRILAAAVGLGLVSTVAGIILQGALASGRGPLDAVDPEVIGNVLGTRFGEVWAIRLGLWATLGGLLALAIRGGGPAPALRQATLGADGSVLQHPPAPLLWAGAALLAALAATPAFAGHAASVEPTAALVPSVVVHVVAMGVWVGGLFMLVAALPTATRALEPADRTRLLASSLHRFSPIALGAVAALLATGVLQSLFELDSPGALIDSTFGRLILVKSALLATLIGLGRWNRRRSIPELDALAERGSSPGKAGVALRRVLRAEVALVTGAIAATAFLAAATPKTSQDGPAAGSADLGAARLDYTVDPARPGANEIHLYLTDPETGAPFEVRSAQLSASQSEREIGPLDVELERTGPGHFTAPAATLSPPGEWSLELRAPLSRFEEMRGEFEVTIE